jgi:DNA-binding transcriptional MerR regulator
VRYYIAQGLLPAPDRVGRGAQYGDGHLYRLRLIRQLQAEHLPLAEIRARLSTLTAEDVRQASASPSPSEPPGSESAVDYIHGVLAGHGHVVSAAAPRHSAPMPASPDLMTTMTMPAPPAVDEPDETLPMAATEPSRSQWDRVALAPDIELHIRRPLSRPLNKKVDRLIAIARQLLEEDQP